MKHGVQEKLLVKDQSVLFQGLPSEFLVGLYHSWKVVDLPDDCQTAQLDNGVAMSLEFPKLRLFAVQFHPESILTEHGLPLLANFLNCAQL